MKIDFNQNLIGLEGTPLTESGQPVSLSQVSVVALMAVYPNETLSGEEKAARYRLAEKIFKKVADLTDGEMAELKRLVGVFFAPNIVGPAYRALETPAS